MSQTVKYFTIMFECADFSLSLTLDTRGGCLFV